MELQAADAYCMYLARRHYENFSVASRVLPRDVRIHLARLYAYCRTTDDLGDESGSDARSRLAIWRGQVETCLEGEVSPIHPVLIALRATVRACELPPWPFLDLIAANVQDQSLSEYETWDDLRAYCMLSAAPVGRLVLRIWGIAMPRADLLSDDVCIGLQLANFAQDVLVDRVKGRSYLLQRDLREIGLQGAVRSLCDRAASLLASGRELEAMVPRRLAVQLALYRLGGMAIVDAIRRLDYRTDISRPRVSPVTKLRIVPQALLRGGGGRKLASLHSIA